MLLRDRALLKNGAAFRAHLMPIAVGMYLPFGLTVPILIGGLIAHFRTRGKHKETHERTLHGGVLFASGVIAGEALTAVGLAGLAALGIASLDPGLSPSFKPGLSILAAVAIVAACLKWTKPQPSDRGEESAGR
jgi:uncharacterized oligopeptide transporter (OPT) family protein